MSRASASSRLLRLSGLIPRPAPFTPGCRVGFVSSCSFSSGVQTRMPRDESLGWVWVRFVGARLGGEGLGGEVEAEHAAVDFVHVHESAGDLELGADLLDAADGEPAGPLAGRTHGMGVHEGADAGVGGELEADADL